MRSNPAILANARELVVPHLRQTIDALPRSISDVVGYHMGWSDSEGNAIEAKGSKSIRPALAFLSAEAAGAKPEDAIEAAVSVELINNASFLHDDVMDGDRFRRHRPTAWVTFGVDRAVCAGDALFLTAPEILLSSGKPGAVEATTKVHRTILRMISGQADDLAISPVDMSSQEWLAMAHLKTGSLVGLATSLGAVLTTGDTALSGGLYRFGEKMGVALQVADDMLGIWGQSADTGGRPPGFDLAARKPTMPIVAAVENDDSGALAEIFRSDHPLNEREIEQAARLVQTCGGLDLARSLIDSLTSQADDELAGLDVEHHIRERFDVILDVGLPEVSVPG